ncbi:hypothetical protein [Curtobacterium sp. NPDC092190]|uniref:hypothetical protein n=1 Tax=Curtobacterium sp. NPDC092190 TaxID=3363973 RepID=UPI003805D678
MLLLVALMVAVVYVVGAAVVAAVLIRRRNRLPAADRSSPGLLFGVLIAAVLVAPLVWAIANATITGIAGVLSDVGS